MAVILKLKKERSFFMKNKKIVSLLCAALICISSLIVPTTAASAATDSSVKITKAENRYNGIFIDWDDVGSTKNYYVYRSLDSGKTYKYVGQTDKSEYNDENVSDWKRYFYIVSTQQKQPTITKQAKEAIAHLGPQLLSIENGVDGVVLTFTHGSLYGKIGIYRQEGTSVTTFSKSTRKGVVSTSGNATETFIDTTAQDGKTYSYRIGSAYLNASNKAEKTLTTKCQKVELKAQKITKSENSKDGIKVYYSSQPGVFKYRVFRKDGTSWKKVADSSSGSVLDKFAAKNNTAYTYTVSALNKNGNLMGPYDEKGTTVKYYSSVSSLTVQNEADGQVLSWKAVPGVQYYAPVVWWPSAKNPGTYEWTSIGVVSGTTAKFKRVTNGKTYKYSVRPCATDKKTALNCDFTPTATATFYAAPQMDSLKNITQGQRVSWKTVPGVTYYSLYVRSSEKENWKKVSDVNGTFWLNKNVKNNTMYYYTVRGLDQNCKLITGYNSYRSGKFYSAPTMKDVTSSGQDVYVTWNSVPGVTYYKLMVKYNNNSNDSKYSQVCITKDTHRYINNAKEGQIYDFIVICVDSKGNEISGWSYGMYTTYKKPVQQQPQSQPQSRPTSTKVGRRIVTGISNVKNKDCVATYYYSGDPTKTKYKSNATIITKNLTEHTRTFVTPTQMLSTDTLKFKDGNKEIFTFSKITKEGLRIPKQHMVRATAANRENHILYCCTSQTKIFYSMDVTLAKRYSTLVCRYMPIDGVGYEFYTKDTKEKITYIEYSDSDVKATVKANKYNKAPDYSQVGDKYKKLNWPVANSNFASVYLKLYKKSYTGKYYTYGLLKSSSAKGCTLTPYSSYAYK